MQRWILCGQYLPIFGNCFVHTSSVHLIIPFTASMKTLFQVRLPVPYGPYHSLFQVRLPMPCHSRDYPILPNLRSCLFRFHMNNAAAALNLCVVLICSHLIILPVSLQSWEDISTSSVQSGDRQQSMAFRCKSCWGIFDSTASYRQHSIHCWAQGTEYADPSNMAEFTF